jgi:hypothetical protein
LPGTKRVICDWVLWARGSPSSDIHKERQKNDDIHVMVRHQGLEAKTVKQMFIESVLGSGHCAE